MTNIDNALTSQLLLEHLKIEIQMLQLIVQLKSKLTYLVYSWLMVILNIITTIY